MSRAECLEMIAKYIAAEEAVLQGKEIAIGGQSGPLSRRFTREDLAEIRKGRQEWERRLVAIDAPPASRMGYSVATFE